MGSGTPQNPCEHSLLCNPQMQAKDESCKEETPSTVCQLCVCVWWSLDSWECTKNKTLFTYNLLFLSLWSNWEKTKKNFFEKLSISKTPLNNWLYSYVSSGGCCPRTGRSPAQSLGRILYPSLPPWCRSQAWIIREYCVQSSDCKTHNDLLWRSLQWEKPKTVIALNL